MDDFFKELGRAVLERWKKENFSLAKFPDIARKALDAKPPSTHIDLPAFMRDFLLNDEQAFQTDSPFGEPEIVAFSHPRFYIQLLFWMDGTTAIHQHEFSGAFHVMAGSSIHAEYAFDDATSVTSHLRVGEVSVKEIELLETGRTVPIVSGPGNIHSLFHLDSPSVTVVVRTQHDPGTGPQFNYLPPGLAIDPLHHDLLTHRRKQLLDVLEQSDDPGYLDTVLAMLGELDFERGFAILQHSMAYLQEIQEWDPAIGTFENKHGELANGVHASLREDIRRGSIKAMRGSISEPEHRFFLALLMNAPTRKDLLALVQKRFPKPAAIQTVLRWAEELLDVNDDGVMLLDFEMPPTLEIASEDQAEVLLAAFAYFAKEEKKLPAALRRFSKLDIEEIEDAFVHSSLELLMA